MIGLIYSRRTLIWLLLAGTTVLSWGMGHGAGFSDSRFASSSIILLAMIKIRYVILEFMELRHAPLPARIVAEVWGGVLCLTLLGLYWHGMGVPT